jgi:UDP-N-acetylglucosamine acyltransferase
MNNVSIHPTSVISKSVEIGYGSIIGPNAVILGPCKIGRKCWVGPNTVIGTTSEHIDDMFKPKFSDDIWEIDQGYGIVIGDNTIIREHTTVHQGTIRETYIGSNCFIMNKSHIGHDAYLADQCRLAPSAMIGGHCYIGEKANVGMAAVIHQKIKIGIGSMIGMNSTVVKNIMPYQLVKGTPAKSSGLNNKLLNELKFSNKDILDLQKYYENQSTIVPEIFLNDIIEWELL